MAFQHIDSFVQAVYTVFAKMLNPELKEVKAGKPFFNNDPLRGYEIAVLVGVLGDIHGQVICGMTEETAKNIISRMLEMPIEEIDEMGKSAICELKNIIIGNASTNLSHVGYKCLITPPLIMMNGQVPSFLEHVDTALAIPIDTPYGKVEINLSLRKDDLAS
ncbi:MAG: chemotaxis protein CheX [Firmicutes bacterium]|nr:chemotaxis protein CheX [Bacillota bacterium]